ncbi:APC family permease [Paraburkholderia elongata]|uniref:Amino acid permease n=1 Tax=Paraburkholderia elongata TaxID=2675747 RepID=A0A972SP59_9BURK|nr:APC family permease [Paraburkholderia elongata]NPT61947.1 amino acid permease [Paraburkholderia elongata]
MFNLRHFPRWLVGPPHNPDDPGTRRRILLTAVLASAGLGANGLSSACYGPEKAFLALGSHPELGPVLAVATATTLIILALAYTQIIALFPSGGGNYKVVSQLLGPSIGLIAGSALLVDYVLTIAVSLASGTDGLFSVLPAGAQAHKLAVEIGLLLLLVTLNLRGVSEAIRFLLPIVLAFLLSHGFLIVYGIGSSAHSMPIAVAHTVTGAQSLSQQIGWPLVAALLLRAYSLGGSSFTGIEAIANNVNLLAKPRYRTGRTTLLSVALALGFVAGGILLLYTLSGVRPVYGQTLNAVAFGTVIARLPFGPFARSALLLAVLALEGAILFVAANSILIFAPSLLGSMATDSWLPHRFCNLSSRLVRQNGVVFVGGCALVILIATHGELGVLVVLYSINVFLSLALAKAGLCRYWWTRRGEVRHWPLRLAVAGAGFAIAAMILLVTLTQKFYAGGWATLCVTLLVIGGCLAVRRHYRWVEERRNEMDALFALPTHELAAARASPSTLGDQAAVLLVTEHWGSAIHTLLWIQRLFPGRFRSVVLVSVVKVQADALGAPEALRRKHERLETSLEQLEAICWRAGLGTSRMVGHSTDVIAELERLIRDSVARFPGCVCFTNQLILPANRRFSELLHNQTALGLQRRLHLDGIPLVVLPITLR